MKGVGTRPTYQIFAVATLLTGLMYFVFNVTYLKKRPQVEGNDIVKKEPKKKKTTTTTAGQNDLENGSVEIVSKEEKKTKTKQNQKIAAATATAATDKEKIAQGYNNKAYSEDPMKIESANPTSKDIEALNNVKNLDKIEKITESEVDHAETEKKIHEKKEQKNDNNTIFNNSTSDDKSQSRKHSVTIEKVPKDKNN